MVLPPPGGGGVFLRCRDSASRVAVEAVGSSRRVFLRSGALEIQPSSPGLCRHEAEDSMSSLVGYSGRVYELTLDSGLNVPCEALVMA